MIIAFLSENFSLEERQKIFSLENKANRIPIQEALRKIRREDLKRGFWMWCLHTPVCLQNIRLHKNAGK